MIGKAVQPFYVEPKDVEKKREVFISEDSEQESITFETRYRKKNGEILDAETVLKKLRNKEREVVGYLGVVRDISNRIWADRQIKKFFHSR